MVVGIVTLILTFFTPISNAYFSDLRPDHWCYDKILFFEEHGYVSGYGDGEFKPDKTITRAEYVTIVNNFFGYEPDKSNTAKFSDVSEADWFEPYVSEAVKRGYISGYPDGTFKPYEPIRRQEATVILAKILNIHDEKYDDDHEDGLSQYNDGDDIDDWAYDAVHSYSIHNFINGYEDNTIRLFRNVTRAETVQLLNTVEEKVIIDRENKTNEIKDKPSGGGGSSRSKVVTPIISVVEVNDDNSWYNGIEAENDDKVTVKVKTTTSKAIIEVKVNGNIIETIDSNLTSGTEVTFELSDGEYEIIASASRSGYRTSENTTINIQVDTKKPTVSGKIDNDNNVVKLYVADNLSGVADDGIEYAWFIKYDENYKRISNWEIISESIDFPIEPQNYYLGIKGSDIAGNKVDGGFVDDNIDENVSDGVSDESFDILKEIIVDDENIDKESIEAFGEPEWDEFIIFHKNDGTEKIYKQYLEIDGNTTLETDIFSREEYTFIGWAESANGTKAYNDGAEVSFTESIDLYAIWELNEISDKPVVVEVKVELIFLAGDNGVLDGEANLEVSYGTKWEEVVIPTPIANSGYYFSSWSPELPTQEKAVTEDTTYTAIFMIDNAQEKEISYTVEYYKDGVHIVEDDIKISDNVWINETKLEVEEVDISNDKYVGYKFSHTNPTEIPETIENGGAIKVYYIKDNTQEKEIGYTVKYYKDGTYIHEDDIAISGKVWINETKLEVEEVDISNDRYVGYKFSHTDPTEIPETVEDGEVIKVYYVKDITQQTEVSYTVEYYKDEVHVVEDDIKISDNVWINEVHLEVEEVDISDDRYAGYEFSHTNPTEIPKTIEDGEVIKVYYASKIYEVIYNANGGESAPSSQHKDFGVDLRLTTSKPINHGYHFIEWNTKSDGSGDSYLPGEFYTIDESVTLYAQWQNVVGLEVEISCDYPTEDGVNAEPGDVVKYELILEAENSSVTLPVVVKIQLDSDVELALDSLPDNVTYDSVNHIINWNVADITDKISYEVTVREITPAGSKISTQIIDGATAPEHIIDVEETVVVKQNKDKNIILVLDVSGSMDYCVIHGETFRKNLISGKRGHGIGFGFYECKEETRIDELKASAKEFVENICNDKGSEDITVTIITFANDAISKGTIKNPTIEQLEVIIDDLSANGGTNMRGAIRAATTVLNGDAMLPEAVNSVVVLSDGDPEYVDYYCDNETLTHFRDTNATAYAIGFGNSYLEDELLNIVDNDSSKLFDAGDGDELKKVFDKIGYALHEEQTVEGIIKMDISDMEIYPIILRYKDSTLVTVEVSDETELNSNHLSIVGNNLNWDISKYPGCSDFEMEANRTKVINTMRLMSFRRTIDISDMEEILEYGDSDLSDNIEETDDNQESELKNGTDDKQESEQENEVDDKQESEPESELDNKQESESENEPGDNQESEAEDEPDDNQESESGNEADDNQESEVENEADDNQESEAEDEPDDNQESESGNEADDNQESEAEDEPDDNQGSESGNEADDNQEPEQESEADDNQESESENGTEDNQEAELKNGTDDNQESEPENEADDNQEFEVENEADDNQESEAENELDDKQE